MIRVKDIPEDKIVFYDIETTSVHATYCTLKMLGYQQGINSEPKLVEPDDKVACAKFRKLVIDPDVYKVSFNGVNFDDIVLWRYGFFIHPHNRHDMYLALKTIHPTLPSYSLKFANLMIDSDQTIYDAVHMPQGKVDDYLLHTDLGMDSLYITPKELLEEYCLHDVRETVNVFKAVWEEVQKGRRWEAYTKLELAMAEPLHEMMLLGREYLDINQILREIAKLEEDKRDVQRQTDYYSHGGIPNIGSVIQIDKFFRKMGWPPLPRTENDRPTLTKADKLQNITNYDKEDANEIPRFQYVMRNHGYHNADGHFSKEGFVRDLEERLHIKGEIFEKGEPYTFYVLSYENNRIAKAIGYLRSYHRAAINEQRRRLNANNPRKDGRFHPISVTVSFEERRHRLANNGEQNGDDSFVYIPKAYRLSAARTRRFQSSSKYKINWQNQNKGSKVVQLVPKGWIGFWIDSTQIENVAHIYFSKDDDRRAAYEADEEWNEYVWLYNTAFGTNYDKATLEKMDSPLNPQWSVYKQFKTVKLALNFGMGTAKFAKTTGLKRKEAEASFALVHKACPAIRRLQHWVREEVLEKGCIEDPFGHIYSGNKDQAYKLVAYLVQGTGTGSVPKAMTIANYNTIHRLDQYEPMYSPWIKHPYKKKFQFAVLTGTTHDECAGRISLGMPTDKVYLTLRELLYNMEDKFSKVFDNIPLRAKLAISITNAAEQKEIDHRKNDFEEKVKAMIESGKKKAKEIITL